MAINFIKNISNLKFNSLLRYVFPVQFVLGCTGNLLILWVIECDNFKNRANDMLAAVSFADLLFMVLMLPHSLATFKYLDTSLTYRLLYLPIKQHLAALANWMSAAAIWFILAVSVERFLVIRSPLRSRKYWKKTTKYSLIISIFVITGVLTSYHHCAYDCEIFFTCNGKQLFQACYPAAEENHPVSWMNGNIIHTSALKRHLIRISTLGNAIMIVFIPIVLVVILNVLLIRQLHINDQTALLCSETKLHRNKYRVTITVIAIGFCLSLTQGPSAVIVLWELIGGFTNKSAKFVTIFSITNSLVVCGKMTNFLLFCVFSTHFRRKFITLIWRKFFNVSLQQRIFSGIHKAAMTTDIRLLHDYP
uniref:G_PROTEIN_RECEP_F1_2 domain-containing protein n=1 Tax=Syphacia muris TaxID=451379 RepID=A0A0N5A9L9_9BILA